MKINHVKTLTAAALLAMLTACSSGGGGSAPQEPKPTPNQPTKPAQPNEQNNAQSAEKPQLEGSQKPAPEVSPSPQPPVDNNAGQVVPAPEMKPEGQKDPYERHSLGLDGQKDKLNLTIKLYEKNPENPNGYQDKPEYIGKDFVIALGDDKGIQDQPNNDYYIASLDKFADGYVGYYYEDLNGNGKKLTPHFVMAVHNDVVMNAPTDLNASFQQDNGFIYSGKNSVNDQIVYKDDIAIEFKQGKVVAQKSKVTNTQNSQETIFNITGDVNSLAFEVVDGNIRNIEKDKAATNQLIYVKDPKGTDPKWVVGSVEGDKFKGVFHAEKNTPKKP